MGDGRCTTRLKGLGVTLVLAVLLACGLGLAGCSGSTSSAGDAAEDLGLVSPGKLSVVSDLANPPFDYIEEGTTNPAGFEVELVQALAQKLGLECEFLPAQKFDSIIPMIKQGGRADVGASNFTITDERLEEIDFTDAYIDSNQGVVLGRYTMGAYPKHMLQIAGVPGLEPRMAEPESAVLPITPYPIGCLPLRSRVAGDRR